MCTSGSTDVQGSCLSLCFRSSGYSGVFVGCLHSVDSWSMRAYLPSFLGCTLVAQCQSTADSLVFVHRDCFSVLECNFPIVTAYPFVRKPYEGWLCTPVVGMDSSCFVDAQSVSSPAWGLGSSHRLTFSHLKP